MRDSPWEVTLQEKIIITSKGKKEQENLAFRRAHQRTTVWRQKDHDLTWGGIGEMGKILSSKGRNMAARA